MTRQRSASLASLVAAVAVAILYASTFNLRSSPRTYLRINAQNDQMNRNLGSFSLAQFSDPKSVVTRSDAPVENDSRPQDQFIPGDHKSRSRCQIIYILGVEGATHHGFIPILEALALNQIDPSTGERFVVDSEPRALKAGLFGWFKKSKIVKKWGFKLTPEVDNKEVVRQVVKESCPDDGKKHVLIEWASFPSGHEDDPRTYRVHRQHEWLTMSPEEIANSPEALQHPVSMIEFYKAYSPYIDIKFVVLHRPYLETIASHRDWDTGPEVHSNIIRGFMIMLRQFLDTHIYDLVDGTRLWSLVCVENIMSKNYESEHDVKAARKRIMAYLTEFLKWPDGDCPQCFDKWHESTKDPRVTLGEENMPIMEEHMKLLEGVWPPPGEVGIPEQQCGI